MRTLLFTSLKTQLEAIVNHWFGMCFAERERTQSYRLQSSSPVLVVSMPTNGFYHLPVFYCSIPTKASRRSMRWVIFSM